MSAADKAFGWFLLVINVLLATVAGGPWYVRLAVASVAIGIAFLLGQERGEARA